MRIDERGIRQHKLRLAAFVLQSLRVPGVRDVHSAERRIPVSQRRNRDTMLPRQAVCLRARRTPK
jgi:hypothetical protein